MIFDASRLRDLINERRLTHRQVEELTGVGAETVSRIVRGATPEPTLETLMKLAGGLEVTVGWLLGEEGFEFSPGDRAELLRFDEWIRRILAATAPERTGAQPPNVSAITLGRQSALQPRRSGRATPVAATNWRESFGDRREEREVDIPQQFAERGAKLVFRAEGDSMLGEHIAHGDLLYVTEEADPRRARGRIVVCVVDGSPYVKRLELAGAKIRLVSANERYPPMVFDENTVDWSLVGVVVGWSHDAR